RRELVLERVRDPVAVSVAIAERKRPGRSADLGRTEAVRAGAAHDERRGDDRSDPCERAPTKAAERRDDPRYQSSAILRGEHVVRRCQSRASSRVWCDRALRTLALTASSLIRTCVFRISSLTPHRDVLWIYGGASDRGARRRGTLGSPLSRRTGRHGSEGRNGARPSAGIPRRLPLDPLLGIRPRGANSGGRLGERHACPSQSLCRSSEFFRRSNSRQARTVASSDTPTSSQRRGLHQEPLTVRRAPWTPQTRLTRMSRQSEPEFARYIARVHAYPRLSREDALALVERCGLHRDEAARKALVESHLRYVVAIALRYRRYGVPVAELIAEG